jgi:hypothetical protein
LTQAAIGGLRLGRGESWGPLWAVADLIKKGRDSSHQSGFPEVDAEAVTFEEAQLLEELTVAALKRHPGLGARYGMIHVLDRVGEGKYLEIFRSELESALGTLSEAGALLYQCLAALEHLGENALYMQGRTKGYSYDDVGFNVERARAYLERQGTLFPF